MGEIAERIITLGKIANDPKKHLRYYRRCLADRQRMDIPADQVSEKGLCAPADEELTESSIKKLFSDIPKEDTRRDILYCPLALRQAMKDGHKERDTTVFPYWIPAILSRSGRLIPAEKDTDIPWLVRGVLSPNEYMYREFPSLSSVERVDRVGASFQFSHDSWAHYLDSARRYFFEQTGSDMRELTVEGWEVDLGEIALLPADLSASTDALLRWYDYYADDEEDLPQGAVRSLLSLRTAEPETVADPLAFALDSRQYGHMTDRFPLNPSQRLSLALLCQTGPGGVLAVNGPPGTGKTTLIQSVVADLIVKAFLGKGRPPVIVGSSANNKAITNILDSFASVSSSGAEKANLHQRWLPGLDALGHYLAARNQERVEDAREAGYFVSTPGTQGADGYRSYCLAHPARECEDFFMGRLREKTPDGAPADLGEALPRIRETVATLCERMDRCIASVVALRSACSGSDIAEMPIVSLAASVPSRLSAYREERVPLDDLIQREHLLPAKPSLFARLIQRIRYGDSRVRKARVQSELLKLRALSENGSGLGLYALGMEAWKRRDGLFNKEAALTAVWEKLSSDFETILPYLADLSPSVLCASDEWVEALQGKLDRGERHDAFWWALHGFEAQWLLKRDDRAYEDLNQGLPQSLERIEQRSYLTPVFVSTFHSLPHFFSYSKKNPDQEWMNAPLTGSVDLLVVDEAGQVAPELAVPAFSLAARALVVGDDKQLEPIWGIPSAPVDYANARMAGIVATHDQYRAFSSSRRGCVNGNLMPLAQDASDFLYPALWSEAGSLLTEHRRCVPEIIEYGNRFVYRSLLDVKTHSEPSEWPALGYCHIGGESRKKRSSQYNPVEARAIASWIKKNEQKLKALGSSNLADAVAIVTPFRAQAAALLAALTDAGIDAKGLVVGTVHALQGAEKPVVIFSPVYGRNHLNGSFFFNQTYNMLNVAVSRAKRHFFVFGNMAAFKSADSGTPAGDLGSLLFRKPENEIPNQFLFKEPEIDFFDREPVDRLDTLNAHRGALKKAFEIAKKRLVIVSPFISDIALRADNVPALLTAAVHRGVEVLVLTDESLDRENGRLKSQSESGRRALEAAGAKLLVLSGIHNKTLIIDRSVFIEGSFNWLSATRDETSQFQRYETSLVVQAPHCERFIVRAEQELGISALEP